MEDNMKYKILTIIGIIIIIPILAKVIISKRKKSKLRKRVLADSSDDYIGTAKNIANSMSKSRNLYKELIVKVHPDNFSDDRIIIATELSSRITKSKRNFDELTKLKNEVEIFLNNESST